MVFDEVFDGLSGFGALLYLVEDDDRLSLVELHTVDELELGEEIVAVGDIGHGLPECCGGIGEIDNDI